jgi:RNA polymerase sigma factor (sigma-70 family)
VSTHESAKSTVLGPGEIEGANPAPLHSDAALVRAVLENDPTARESFVARMQCVSKILAALNSRQGRPLDDDTLADLAQDTVIVVWRKLPEFCAPGPLEAWVYGIAYLEFRNACRRKSRARTRQVPLSAAMRATSEQESESDSPPWDDIEMALSRLDPEDCSVIRMRHDEELSFDAIGARLGVPMNTAKTRYHRGLQKLREWFRRKSNQEEHPR